MAKKTPDEIVAEIDRKQNEEDLDLIPRAGRMMRDKANEDLTGGAYVGNRLDMGKDRGSRLGRVSKEDSDMIMKQDAASGMNRNPRMGGLTFGMKKGGKVMKNKAKRYEDGGSVDRIGESVRERAMRSVANKTDEGDTATITRNEYGDVTPTLDRMEKAAPRKSTPAAAKSEPAATKADAAPVKKSNVDELKSMVFSTANKPSSFKDAGGSSKAKVFSANLDELSQKGMPSSFKDTGGNTKSKASNASLSGLGFPKARLYDPLAKFERKPEGMKSGGKVKSASARADGCAIRGKTRA